MGCNRQVISEGVHIPGHGVIPTRVLAVTLDATRRGPWDLVGCDWNRSV